MSSFPFCWDVKYHGTVVQDPASQKKMAKDRQSSEWWLRILGFANLTILSYILRAHRSTPQNVGSCILPTKVTDFYACLGTSEHNLRHSANTEAESNIFGLKLVWSGFEQAIWTTSSHPISPSGKVRKPKTNATTVLSWIKPSIVIKLCPFWFSGIEISFLL